MLFATAKATLSFLTHLYGSDIYLGFVRLKDLERKLAHRIVSEQEARGYYQSLADFVQRIPLGRQHLALLIRVGAFRFTGKNKH